MWPQYSLSMEEDDGWRHEVKLEVRGQVPCPATALQGEERRCLLSLLHLSPAQGHRLVWEGGWCRGKGGGREGEGRGTPSERDIHTPGLLSDGPSLAGRQYYYCHLQNGNPTAQ